MSQSQADISPSLAPPPALEVTQLRENQQKRVHLVTWSQADDRKLPDQKGSRRGFATLVVDLFANTGNHVQHWSCSRELHRYGGHHYHLALQFTKKARWFQVAKKLREMNIYVNFQSFQTTYKDAFQYVTKEDKDFEKSQGHPIMLPAVPKTMQTFKRALDIESSSSSTPSSSSIESSPQPPAKKEPKIERLTNIQFGNIVIENNIKTDLELCALAQELNKNKQCHLANWMMNHPNEKVRLDLIKTAWKMHTASDIVNQANTPRLEKLRLYLDAAHAIDEDNGNECGGRWLKAACEILAANNISLQKWQELMKNCLRLGRTKRNNLFLVGERNCGKTFLLQPLTKIFTTFCNPASGTFNWVGAVDKELIYLNDFRYPPVDKGGDKVINWQDFLNLCDGNIVSVASPKTHYAQDLQWTAKQPIVATGSQLIKYVRAGMEDRIETAMMDCRWVYIYLRKSIADEDIDNTLVPCPRCFAHLILDGMDMIFV